MSRVPADIHEVLRSRAAQNGGALSFRDFTETALFDANFGYYRKNRARVGRGAGTDFYTAASLGGVFGRLVRAAAGTLISANSGKIAGTADAGTAALREFALVEIGAEPAQTHFAAQSRFFREFRTLRLGEATEIPENAIVVANELLDAQPFYRLVSRAGTWREIGVAENPRERGDWQEILLENFSSPEIAAFAATLPELARGNADDGRHIDISLDAETLLARILGAIRGRGAAIFFDYGKTLADCLDAFPQGTARAYFRHTQSNALTHAPGEQDLTCHVFWDRLARVFEKCGFRAAPAMRQEKFFMQYAQSEIAQIVASRAPEAERERAVLKELILPIKMGHAFQVLAGTNF